MKRLALYDGLIALSALLVWIALVLVEVEVKEFWFFKYVFWGSLLLLFIAFPTASLLALKNKPELRGIVTALSVLFAAPAFILVGGLLVSCFKIMIGGHVS